jgi:hypothetical protein
MMVKTDNTTLYYLEMLRLKEVGKGSLKAATLVRMGRQL